MENHSVYLDKFEFIGWQSWDFELFEVFRGLKDGQLGKRAEPK